MYTGDQDQYRERDMVGDYWDPKLTVKVTKDSVSKA